MEIVDIQNIKDINGKSINLFMLVTPPEKKATLSYYLSKPQDEKDLYEKLYLLFSNEEIEQLRDRLGQIQRDFKNTVTLTTNLIAFFENAVIYGQEDTMMMALDNNREMFIKVRTSDYGMGISYEKNSLNANNISDVDKSNIIEAVFVLSMLSNDLEAAESYKESKKMNNDIKDLSLKEKNKLKLRKF